MVRNKRTSKFIDEFIRTHKTTGQLKKQTRAYLKTEKGKLTREFIKSKKRLSKLYKEV